MENRFSSTYKPFHYLLSVNENYLTTSDSPLQVSKKENYAQLVNALQNRKQNKTKNSLEKLNFLKEKPLQILG